MHWYFWVSIVVAIFTFLAMPQAKWYMAHRPARGILIIAIAGLLWPLMLLPLVLIPIAGLIAVFSGKQS